MTVRTEIIWDGPERFIPDVGMAVPSKSLMVETDKAKSFVGQGLAKFPESKVKPKQKEVK